MRLLIRGENWIFKNEKADAVLKKKKQRKGRETMVREVTMRYRMSDRDVFYGGGVVNGARSITYMGDVAERLMAKLYGNVGRCSKVKKIRLFVPCHAGDYMEFKARLNEETEGKAVIEVRSFKVCELPENPPFPSSIDMMTDPPLSTVGIFEYEIPEGWGNAAEGEE